MVIVMSLMNIDKEEITDQWPIVNRVSGYDARIT